MKAIVKKTGKEIEVFSDGKGNFDHPIDHCIFERYNRKELSFSEEKPSEDLEKAAEEYAQDEMMSGLAERAFKAGAEWQKKQQPASGNSEKPNNQEDLEKEREGLSPTMLTYAADVFGGKILIEDISYSYRQELSDYFRDLAKLPKEDQL